MATKRVVATASTISKTQKQSGAKPGYVKVKGGLKSTKTGKTYKGASLADRKKALKAAYANGWKG